MMSMSENTLAIYLLIFLTGSLLGALLAWLYHYFALGGVKRLGLEVISRAEMEAEELKRNFELNLKHKEIEQQRQLEHIWQQERKKIQREDERLKQREDKNESRMNLVEKKLFDIEKREAILISKKTQLDEEKKQTAEYRKY